MNTQSIIAKLEHDELLLYNLQAFLGGIRNDITDARLCIQQLEQEIIDLSAQLGAVIKGGRFDLGAEMAKYEPSRPAGV